MRRLVYVCGTIRVSDPTRRGEVGGLYGIYIDPDFIGHGAGSLLMERMLELLKKDGYTKATLWVLDSNEKTRRFYEKKGWVIEGGKKEDMRDNFVLNETRYIISL
jgi:GNAT superfamily N-acetyltransferase